MRKIGLLSGVVAGATALALTGCGGDDDTTGSETGELQTAMLTLNWVPYGEHVPFYYGVEQGFYEEEGIDLTIRKGGGSGRTVEAVAGLHTEFGWADTPVLLNGISNGMEVKSAGVFLQKGPASIEFLAEQGIESPDDLKGMTIAGTPGDAMYSNFEAWLTVNGLSMSDVTVQDVEAAAKVALLAEGQVDAIMGFFHDQGPTIEHASGEDVEALLWADFGMNMLGTGIVVHDQTIAEDPDLVAAFVRATVRSFEEAAENPDDAVKAMFEGADAPHAEDVLAKQFEETINLLHTPNTEGERPGTNAEADWQETISLLVEAMNVADEPPSYYWDASFQVDG
jgi:NitT/TauT family transport system substrate-binding protein